MRKVFLILVLAVVAAYWFGFKGQMTGIQDGAPGERGAAPGPRQPDERHLAESDQNRRDLRLPIELETPAAVGRALEDQARRALEALTRSYDAPTVQRGREVATNTPAGQSDPVNVATTPGVVPDQPDHLADEHAASLASARDLSALHDEVAALQSQRRSDGDLIERSRSKTRELETELHAQREGREALDDKLAEAERNAASAEKDRAQLQDVTGDLATVRAQLAQATLLRDQAHEQAEAAQREGEKAAIAERTRADALATRLSDSERMLAARTASLREEADRDAVRERVAVEPTPPAQVMAAALSAALPDEMPAHVVLHYARASEPARRRAEGLGLALKGQGLDVAEPVETPIVAALDRVTFFYKRDESNAKRIAGILASAEPVQGRLPVTGSVPRPGTIEVAITN